MVMSWKICTLGRLLLRHLNNIRFIINTWVHAEIIRSLIYIALKKIVFIAEDFFQRYAVKFKFVLFTCYINLHSVLFKK